MPLTMTISEPRDEDQLGIRKNCVKKNRSMPKLYLNFLKCQTSFGIPHFFLHFINSYVFILLWFYASISNGNEKYKRHNRSVQSILTNC